METKQLFESRGQGQVFQFWNELDELERGKLLKQAEEIDLGELDHLVATLVKSDGSHADFDFARLKPAPYTKIPEKMSEVASWQKARIVGETALRDGEVAAFTVAGGQGTRLGYEGPKGTFPVTPVKKKSLFHVFAEKILAAKRRYKCELPWYIMTSHLNHEATVAFFEENDYFGLTLDSVCFFKQGRMPAVDFDGKIILESKSEIAMSPDGHGGAMRALERAGALEEMEKKGIKAISYFQVDNPLVQAIDPYFIGFHFQLGSTMSSKMLPKAYEKEKLGNFCALDGVTTIVEYSDMPDDLCALRDDDGQLSFRAGSIAIHIIELSFARKLADSSGECSLPFHRADKKIPFVDNAGVKIIPDSANGVKFEMFVFDAVPFSSNPLILEATRLGDFSPVKNAKGVDSPESCTTDQIALFRSWLEAAGETIPDDATGKLEVSPLYADSEEAFTKHWKASSKVIDYAQDCYID